MPKRLTMTILVALLTLVAASADGALSPTELHDLSYQASQLFRQANDKVQVSPDEAAPLYKQAILRYRRIIDEGQVVNGFLYYNIGNAYLLSGDIGRAIVNYRRAQLLLPNDPDLAKNLDYARSQRQDQTVVPPRQRVLETLFFWHYDLGPKAKFTLAGCSWAGFCVVLSFHLLKRRRRPLRWLAVVCLLLTAALASSVALDEMHRRSRLEGVIVAASVVARQGDGENYPASFESALHRGTEFGVVEQRPGWLRIRLSNSDEAWIPASAAEII